MFEIIINWLLSMLLVIWVALIYAVIKIYFITKEIRETWTLKNIWLFEYMIRDYINEDIKKRHESTSK
jgi:hypothetical protein